MKKLILFVVTFAINAVYAADPQLICTPTIADGNVNYRDAATGLNRISSIVVTNGSAGDGGYGVVLTMTGTSGVGDKAATSTVNLPWSSSYGTDLIEYDNIAVAKNDANNPYIRFEIEKPDNAKPFLAALTFFTMNNAHVPQLMTSRYNCQAK